MCISQRLGLYLGADSLHRQLFSSSRQGHGPAAVTGLLDASVGPECPVPIVLLTCDASQITVAIVETVVVDMVDDTWETFCSHEWFFLSR